MPVDIGPFTDAIQLFGVGATLAFVLLRLEASMHQVTNSIDRLTLRIAVLLDRNARATERVETLLDDLSPPKV